MFYTLKHLNNNNFLSNFTFKKSDHETSSFLAICFFVQINEFIHINLTNINNS
jgi:hypothetical protein